MDISDERATVLRLLGEYDAHDVDSAADGDEGKLDEADEELLRLQEQGGDEAEEYFQSARNRIRLFREALDGEREGFVVVTTRPGSDGDETLDVTVVNNTGEPTSGRVTVTFYDADGNELETTASETAAFDPDEQRTVSVPIERLEAGERYVASAERAS
ncbi:hypothetical protein K933_02521 [Candidatus Halobonum tyrrellensis G22]|uniref:Mannosidase Ig/CBM-like domain-containing protein n=2 Tax=Candidatus Halobonum TaxID=1431544 RepID=V4GXF6_9EURY|nr:hypothetical protein K933_02521 [Candidatus Halobonum tyrrellensis G22]